MLPKRWLHVLETVQKYFPTAIIAGGAIRDTYCELPIKDVDLFAFNSDDSELDKNLKALAEDLEIKKVSSINDLKNKESDDYLLIKENFVEDKNEQQLNYLERKNKNLIYNDVTDSCYVEDVPEKSENLIASFIDYIIDFRYSGINFQLILIEESNPIKYVKETFDFGLCKCWSDGKSVTFTDEFWYDYDNKQLTMAGIFSKSQMLHTILNHKPRLQSKFKNWTFVIDDVKERTEDEFPPSYQILKASKEDASKFMSVEVEISPAFHATNVQPMTEYPQVAGPTIGVLPTGASDPHAYSDDFIFVDVKGNILSNPTS